MRSIGYRLAAAVLVCCAASPVLATEKPAQDKAAIAAEIRELEANPLAPKARQRRTALFQWLAEAPDVSVKWCAGLLLEVGDSDKELAGILLIQSMLSAAAFTIEKPNEASDALLVARAGVRGALRAYRSIHEEKPKKAVAFLDDLLKKDEAGTLDDYLKTKLASCE